MTVEYVGPFEKWSVIVNGWEVPLLDALPVADGMVSLTLDRRYGLDLTVEEAERFVPFLAQAIAVASGYASHPSSESQQPTEMQQVMPRRLQNISLDESGRHEAH